MPETIGFSVIFNGINIRVLAKFINEIIQQLNQWMRRISLFKVIHDFWIYELNEWELKILQ